MNKKSSYLPFKGIPMKLYYFGKTIDSRRRNLQTIGFVNGVIEMILSSTKQKSVDMFVEII